MIILVGCAHRVTINPNITPTANIANKIKQKVGLFIPEPTRKFIISGRVQANDPINKDKYFFYVGEALDAIITKSTRRVFTSVEVLISSPTEQMIVDKNLNLVAIATVKSGHVSLGRSESSSGDKADGSTSISVQLTFYDRQMHQFTAVGVSSSAVASKPLGYREGQKEFSISVESALRNLANELVYQIYQNHDIRKKAGIP